MSEATPLLNAMDNPEHRKQLEYFIMLMRMAIAPTLNADLDNLPMNQSLLIAAGQMFAGMTAGHMLAIGLLDESKGDLEQARKAAAMAFDEGVAQGKHEAQRAMIADGLRRGGRRH